MQAGVSSLLALQLLQVLEQENARLEAALEWRRYELVFWQWMVSMPCAPRPSWLGSRQVQEV